MFLLGRAATLKADSFVYPYSADPLAKTSLRHYRQMTKTVLRWYLELEDGYVATEEGRKFDVRVLDYRIDVANILKKFPPQEVNAVLFVNRDGLTYAMAVQKSGIQTKYPDRFIEDVEIRLGQAFERLGLDEFVRYLDLI